MKWTRLGALLWLLAFTSVMLVLWSELSTPAAAANAPAMPQAPAGGQHCPGGGPYYTGTVSSYCGCTWGFVYYGGVPVSGSTVTLSYGNQTLTTTTDLVPDSPETSPIFVFEAKTISATYGSLVTLTATYLGETFSRTVRLIPQRLEPVDDREQALQAVFRIGDPPAGVPKIDSINVSPMTTTQDATILHFVAQASSTNPSYQIVSYEWRSNLDGVLGSMDSFEYLARFMSVGQHVISVKALDRKGMWSAPVTTTLTVVDTPPTATATRVTPSPEPPPTDQATSTTTPTSTPTSTAFGTPSVTPTATSTAMPKKMMLPLVLK